MIKRAQRPGGIVAKSREPSDSRCRLRRLAVTAVVTLVATAAAFQVAAATNGVADSAAALLDQTRLHRETLSADFPGFRSKLVVHQDDARYEGAMLFRPPITLEVQLDDADVRTSVKRLVRSLLSHRMKPKRPRASADRNITFAEEDGHPLGRRILLGDDYSSSYRIRDLRILEVDRRMKESRLVITVMETEETHRGTYLPTHFFVTTFDKESGAVQQSSVYADEYREIGGEYLPHSRRVVSTSDGRTEVLFVEWEEIELLSPVNPPD